MGDQTYTVGYLRVNVNWIDNPTNQIIVIAVVAGGVGGIILLIVLVVIFIGYRRRKARRQQQQLTSANGNIYHGISTAIFFEQYLCQIVTDFNNYTLLRANQTAMAVICFIFSARRRERSIAIEILSVRPSVGPPVCLSQWNVIQA